MISERTARRPIPTLLTTMLLCAAVAAPAQAADWGSVAIDSAGTAHFSWSRSDGARYVAMGRARPTTGTLTRTQYVSSPDMDVGIPGVLAGPAGSALHHWKTHDPADSDSPADEVLRVRRRSADGSLGVEQSISPVNISEYAAAMDPKGNAVFVWTRLVAGKLVVETRRRSVSGALSTIQRLSASSATYHAEQLDVAVDAAGNAVAVWTLLTSPRIVQVRRRAVDGTLSPLQNVTTTSAAAAEPQVGVDSAGNAVVAFRRSVTEGAAVQVRRRSATGELGAIQTLSPPGGTEPQVAVSPGAGAVVSWLQSEGPYVRLYARRQPPGGSWTPMQDIAATTTVHDFRLGIDADGDAILAWARDDEAKQIIQIRRRSTAGVLSSIETLTPPEHVPEFFRLNLGVEPGGGAVATWVSVFGSTKQVFARRRTATGELSAVQQISY